ncbi:ankyrin [Xylaria cubensis]|nr:ankyrin [Xylaria cubensis]
MEFGTAASAATFIVLAAQLSKTLYTAFDSIKDGPANVQAVAGDILRFHGALEQLKGCPTVANDLSGPIRACYLDLEPLADKIRGLQLKPNEKKSGKLWKRFKSFLNEKILDQIRTRVNVLTNDIHLRLSILQSFIADRISSDVRLTGQSIGEASGKIDQLFASQVSSFATIDQSLQSFQSSQQTDLQTGLSSIHDAIRKTESIRQADANSMLNILSELKGLMLSQNRIRQGGQAEDASEDATEDHDRRKKNFQKVSTFDDSLVTSIIRLCSLIDEKERSFNTDEDDDPQAEGIINDMQSMIRSAQDYAEAKQGKTGLYSDLRRFDKAFGQVKLFLNSARNEGSHSLVALPRKRKYVSFELGNIGTVSLVTSRRIKISCDTEDDNSTSDIDRVDCKSVMRFLPKDIKKLSMLMASNIRQGYTGESISSLAVNRVLPARSPVFEVVHSGQLHKLQDMLRRGEASLRDHDEYGASLLFYSTTRPEMCRFLLSTGLDVDHMASSHVLDTNISDCYAPQEELERVMKCRTLLLEAGADPTLEFEQFSFLQTILRHGTPESIKAIWGSTLLQPFADINYVFPNGCTPLLEMCENYGTSFSAENFSFLLKRGANIKARDTRGRTCLHICLSSLRDLRVSEQHEAIVFLIQNGADIDARDDDGKTVHEIAYLQDHCKMGLHIGSLAGDLWDSVLEAYEYDILKLRQKYQRRAVYRGHYTRQNFVELWKGRESHCPYLDDVPWPAEAPWHRYTCDEECWRREKYSDILDLETEPSDDDKSNKETDFGSDDGAIEEVDLETDSQSAYEVESENETTQDEVFLADDSLIPSNAFDLPLNDTVEYRADSIDDIDDARSSQPTENRDESDTHLYVNVDNPESLALYQNPWSD